MSSSERLPDLVESTGPAPSLFVARLLAHVRESGHRPAVSFVADRAPLDEPDVVTYGQLDRAARRLGGWLQARYPAGSRLLLLYPQGVEFVLAFVGCLYAGMVPVPAPLPGGNQSQQARVNGIVRSAGTAAVLTDGGSEAEVTRWLAECGHGDVDCVAGLAGGDADAMAWRRLPDDPDALAFLQFTSGSTSEPRGVMVSHRNLVRNLELSRQAFGLPAGLRAGGWLPFYHDMGLIGLLLLPLYLGGHSSVISPASFLRRPHRWLELIDRHDIQLSAAPNFAFDLCVRRVSAERVASIDLSRWAYACNGAEPIHAGTLHAFADHLAPAGLRPEALVPCYGMAETVVFVTGDRPDRVPVTARVHAELLEQHQFVPAGPDDAARVLVSSGPVPTGYRTRIVDPDSGKVLPDGRVGEIWLRGPCVTNGYWGLPELSERTFLARTADGEGPFLRTGDLGTCHDGELFVTGRCKELIIVHGRNVYPQDIEREVAALHPALAGGGGAAFDVPGEDGRDAVVVVHEVLQNAGSAGDLPGLAATVRTGLSRSLGVAVGNVAFVPPGAVRRSTSGKIQRVAMRELFTGNALQPLFELLEPDVERRYRGATAAKQAEPAEPASPERTEWDADLQRIHDELFRQVATVVELDPAGQAELRPRFATLRPTELGLDSLTAVRLRFNVLRELGVDLSPQQLIGAATVADIVTAIHQRLLLARLTTEPVGAGNAGQTADQATGEVEEFEL